jgi:hypothetical protein
MREKSRQHLWVHSSTTRSDRTSAQRLKPQAIDNWVSMDPVHCFLGSRRDTRSSLYLEDATTELQVKRMELDCTIVAWKADL